MKTPPPKTPPASSAPPTQSTAQNAARVHRLPDALRDRLVQHANASGQDVSELLEKAITGWLDSVGTPADPDSNSEPMDHTVTDAPNAQGRTNPLARWALSDADAAKKLGSDAPATIEKYAAMRGKAQR